MVKRTGPTPAEALTIAEAVFHTRYSSAAFAYAAGSIMRGEGTYLSDIDLVVVFDHLDAARRESFIFDDVPIEAYVHDRETLGWFVNEDAARGRPSILNMIVEGKIIGRDQSGADRIRADVSVRLGRGPLPLSTAALDALRYEITDAVDDLRGDRTADEVLATGATLYPKLVELALRGRGRWNGAGKWAPRLLTKIDPELGVRFDSAFRALFTKGDAGPVITLAEAELASHGGPLFDGDRRDAPASWRIAYERRVPDIGSERDKAEDFSNLDRVRRPQWFACLRAEAQSSLDDKSI